ncbi:hypothetical protein BC828DRAFT_374588 [Blastocladiella britannica]|nr:hypothetical protein BC828DRAFT_374588 [Blastocladiella britannica]
MLQQLQDQVDLAELQSAVAAVSVPEDRLAEIQALSDPDQLKALLLDAYATIAAKERDLVLAAQIGQSLLDANNDLRAALLEAETSAPARFASHTRAQMAAAADAAGDDAAAGLSDLAAHARDLEFRVDALDRELRETRATHRREAKQLAVELDRERARAEQHEQRAADLAAARDKLARDAVDLKAKMTTGARDADADAAATAQELEALVSERDTLAEANGYLARQLASAVTKADDATSLLEAREKQVAEFADLQESWKYQAKHIVELRELIDEQRVRIAKLSGAADANATSGMRAVPQTRSSEIAVEKSHTSLISELEAVWVKEHGEPKSGFTSLLDGMRGMLLNN